GRRTAESIGRALPGRRNLVLTRHGQAPSPGQVAAASLDEATRMADGARLFVIGGRQVYAAATPRATRLVLGRVDAEVARADALFPAFDATQWCIVAEDAHRADERHEFAYRFVDYQRRASA